MKKRKIAATVVVMSIISQTASAEINTLTGDGSSWSVRGNFRNVGKGTAALEVLKPGKTVHDEDPYAYMAEIPIDKNGNFASSFFINGESGEYILRIGAKGQIFEKNFVYARDDELSRWIELVNGANSAAELADVFESEYGRLKSICGVMIKPEDKQFTYNSFYNSIPNGGFSDFTALKNKMAEVVLINQFNKASENLSENLSMLFDYFNTDAQNALTVWNNSDYMNDALKEKTSKNIQNDKCDSIENLQNSFCERVILVALTQNNSKAKELSVLKIVHGNLQLNEYNYFIALNESQQISILSRITGNCADLSGYCGMFDAAARAYRDEQNNKNQESLSGGSFAGQAGAVVVPPNQDKKDTNTQTGGKPEESQVFTDIDAFGWAKTAILNLYNKGIVQGKSNGIYAPSDSVKREEFISIIIKALKLMNENAVYDGFDDVGKDNWYYGAVASAVEKGVANGISETEFGSGRNITRQDVVLICKRAAEAAGVSFESNSGEHSGPVTSYEYSDTVINPFEDWEEVSDYAAEAVKIMYNAEIVAGDENGRFNPTANMTRAESAVVVERLMKLVSEKAGELSARDKAMTDKLSAFGMYSGGSNGFNSELTRGETAKLLCELLNITPDNTQPKEAYSDCGSNNQYTPYIYAISNRGFMGGIDGRFESDSAMTYNEAIKIAVKALGEGDIAEKNGGTYDEYLKLAASHNITEGVERTQGNGIKKGSFLRMFDNMLEEKVLVADWNKNEFKYTPQDDNFLSVYHGIYKGNGKIVANPSAGIMGEEQAGQNELKIGNRRLTNKNKEYNGYIGRDVIYYYRDNKVGDSELVYLIGKNTNKVTVLTSSEITGFKNMQYTYTPEGTKTEKTLRITNNANFIYNTKTIYDYTDEMLNPKSGTVTLIDSDGNGTYTNEDTIIIDSYKNIVVSGIDSTNAIIYDKYASSKGRDDYNINLNRIESYTIKDKHGDEYGLRELREWDVLAAKIAPDNSYAEITLIDECCGGKVTAISDTNHEIEVDGNTYEFSKDFGSNISSATVGKDATVYWDLFGKVCAVRDGISSSAVTSSRNEESKNVERLVILTRFGITEDGTGKYIKMYGSDKKMSYNELSDKLTVNRKKCNDEELAAIMDEQLGKAVLVEINDKNEVIKITTAAMPGEDSQRGLWLINYPGESLLYKSDIKSFGNRFIIGSNVYTIPDNKDDFNKTKSFYYNNANFTNDTSYVLDAYTTTLDGIVADAVVYKGSKSGKSSYDVDTSLVIGSIDNMVNDDDEVVLGITGLGFDSSRTIASMTYELDPEAVIVDSAGMERDDVTIADLQPGDCIRYGLEENVIKTIDYKTDDVMLQ